MSGRTVLLVLFVALLTIPAVSGIAAIFLRRHRLELGLLAAFSLGGVTGLGWLIIFKVLP
jgi:hypothetical protein